MEVLMKIIKTILLSFLVLPLMYCANPFGKNSNGNTIPIERDYDSKRDKDENRDEVIERSLSRYADSSICEKEADRKHKCKETCKNIYTRRDDVESCEELSVDQIANFKTLHDILKDPNEDDLKEINTDDFDVYLNISIAPFDKLLSKYSSKDAEKFIIWMITNEEVSKIFREEDDEYKSLETLLKSFNNGDYNSNGDEISKPFIKKLSDDKLMEEALENELILDWFQDYINDTNTACRSNTETKSCFTVYCKIGRGIDRSARDDWLDFDGFNDYIEDIIDEKINSRQGTGNNRNANGWIHEDAAGNSEDEIGNAGDLDDWMEDLCQDLQ